MMFVEVHTVLDLMYVMRQLMFVGLLDVHTIMLI